MILSLPSSEVKLIFVFYIVMFLFLLSVVEPFVHDDFLLLSASSLPLSISLCVWHSKEMPLLHFSGMLMCVLSCAISSETFVLITPHSTIETFLSSRGLTADTCH